MAEREKQWTYLTKWSRIAVERLFEKKTGKASKPKIGDKFVVVGNSGPFHRFKIGEIVTFDHFHRYGVHWYESKDGMGQYVNECDVVPYKGEAR